MKKSSIPALQVVLEKSYEKARAELNVGSLFNKPALRSIKYPLKPSEAEIQATLWLMFKRNDIDARLEVSDTIENKISKLGSRITQNRFDIVIFRKHQAVCIIEIKKDPDYKTRDEIKAEYKRLAKIRKEGKLNSPTKMKPSRGTRKIKASNNTRSLDQARKYAKYQVPTFFCVGLEQIKIVHLKVKNYYDCS